MGLPEAMQCYLKLLVPRLLAFDSSRSEFSRWPCLPLVTPKQVGSSARYLARQAAKSLQHGGCVEAVRSPARRFRKPASWATPKAPRPAAPPWQCLAPSYRSRSFGQSCARYPRAYPALDKKSRAAAEAAQVALAIHYTAMWK